MSLRERAIKLLDVLGADYVVAFKDGEVARKGDLEAVKPKRSTPKKQYKHIYQPYLETLDPDTVIEIPVPTGVDAAALGSVVSAQCITKWGRGSVMTAIDRKRNIVEVARMGG